MSKPPVIGLPLLTQALVKPDDGDIIQSALEFVRGHLDMEIAYLSEFVGDGLVFRRISAPGFEHIAQEGDVWPLDQVYCQHILEGRLPELITDTADFPFTQSIPITEKLPVRAHVSIPIKRRDGSVYGMFCCLNRVPRPSLNMRDHEVMCAFARLSSEAIDTTVTQTALRAEIVERITGVMADRAFNMVYQPILASCSREVMGFEALCRFHPEPYRSPDKWFAEAGVIGLQIDLEICVIKEALQALHSLPNHVYVSVNAGPQTIISGRLMELFEGWPAERIVLELTEHEEVSDYEALLKQVDLLRFKGIRIAIDDAGAGYAGLQQIVRLRPDIIKLDMSLTSNVDKDVVRRSLASALTQFARDTNAKIVAEGVETESEFAALLRLEVGLMQGYLLGKPNDLASAVEMCTPGYGLLG